MSKTSGDGEATKPDLRVWITLHPDGEPLGVRVVELADGRLAYMPERLYIEVAPDGDGTSARESGTHRMGWVVTEDGEQIVEGSDESFTKGRQVVIDADTTTTGGLEIRAVTVFRADGPLRPSDVTKGLRIEEYAEAGLRNATGWLSGVIPTGVIRESREGPSSRSGGRRTRKAEASTGSRPTQARDGGRFRLRTIRRRRHLRGNSDSAPRAVRNRTVRTDHPTMDRRTGGRR